LLEPFVPIYNALTAIRLHVEGQNEAAIQMLEAIPLSTGGGLRNLFLAQVYAAAGRYSEAADTLLAIPQDQNRISRQSAVEAARLLRTAPAKVRAPETLPLLGPGMDFVYLYVGAPDRVMDRYERFLGGGGDGGGNFAPVTWAPEFAPVRKTERFKAYVRRVGLVEYWRAAGWPDLCHPVGADDFACE
jgi:hypothetical protein